MSASPIARQVTQVQAIPTKRVVIDDPSQLPVDYSSTPGGTLYSTTPGGTRIVYDRNFLMNLRNSPVSRTPPRNLSSIPARLQKSSTAPVSSPDDISKTPDIPVIEESNEQFEMDM